MPKIEDNFMFLKLFSYIFLERFLLVFINLSSKILVNFRARVTIILCNILQDFKYLAKYLLVHKTRKKSPVDNTLSADYLYRFVQK